MTQDPRATAPVPCDDRGGGVAVGLVLIALGGVLLLGQLEVIDSDEVLRRGWPIVPIVAGLWWLVRSPRLGGAIVLGAGLLWGANANDLVTVDIGAVFWPIVLVVIGSAVVVAAVRSPLPGGGGTQVAIFDDRDWTGSADDLPGSTLVTIFGDADLHLTAPRRAPTVHPLRSRSGPSSEISPSTCRPGGGCGIGPPACSGASRHRRRRPLRRRPR